MKLCASWPPFSPTFPDLSNKNRFPRGKNNNNNLKELYKYLSPQFNVMLRAVASEMARRFDHLRIFWLIQTGGFYASRGT